MEKFKNMFSTNVIVDESVKGVANVDDSIDFISEYLHRIDEMILKLEIINTNFNDIEDLTDKIECYKRKIESLKELYENGKVTSEISLDTMDKSLQYKVELSTLVDQIFSENQSYFYLESLDTFLHQDIDKFNIEEKREQLLGLEERIQNYSESNASLKKKLQKKLTKTLWYFMKREVKISEDWNFYSDLSIHSQLSVQRKFLKKVLKRVDEDSYVKDYVQENDIMSLSFDYNMFFYIVEGKKRKKLNNSEEKNNQSTGLVVQMEEQSIEPKKIGISNLQIVGSIFTFFKKIKISIFGGSQVTVDKNIIEDSVTCVEKRKK